MFLTQHFKPTAVPLLLTHIYEIAPSCRRLSGKECMVVVKYHTNVSNELKWKGCKRQIFSISSLNNTNSDAFVLDDI